MEVRDIITKLPISTDKKLKIYGHARKVYWKVKYNSDLYNNLVKNYTLIPQNSFYGHEYWLKRYSEYMNNSIKALIEHGLFWKCEKDRIGWSVEWDIGSIFTFGDARYDVLKDWYPDYNIVRIGPRIHYAPVDEVYRNELLRKIDQSKKTMVLYPVHSLAKFKNSYDMDSFLNDAYKFAKENDIGNILISLHPSDYIHGADVEYLLRDQNLIPVTGGTDNIQFLPRIKAILSVADITYSNTVGTHTGYSIYMNKPHVINVKSDSPDEEKPEFSLYSMAIQDYEKEKNLFINAFDGSNPWEISSEQRELIDYYFGLSHVKTIEELYKEVKYCEDIYQKKY